jgi:hypothetical protein
VLLGDRELDDPRYDEDEGKKEIAPHGQHADLALSRHNWWFEQREEVDGPTAEARLSDI